ncbi:MAG: hypothetical protein ACJ8AT_04015 [Hyalangium sp.]|uniref:hypothetical protein n=1 Tax=Hyalangium sp. TaxID=2028555 RepID=UPI00389A3772
MDKSPYVSILRDVFHVQDVSAREEERARVNKVPELSGPFEKLGFQSVGFYRMGRSSGSVHQVWRSPDSRAFLTVEHDQNQKPRAELRTLLHDGTIIDTSSHHSGLARLYRRSRIHHPESLYLMETLNGSPEALWRRHSERVESILRERGSTIPPHDSMRMQFALASRSMVVTFVRRIQGRRLEWTVFIPATLAIVGAVVFAGTPLHWLTAAAVAGVALWYIGEFSTWLAARLMSIPPVPLASLLAAVDNAALAGPPAPTS